MRAHLLDGHLADEAGADEADMEGYLRYDRRERVWGSVACEDGVGSAGWAARVLGIDLLGTRVTREQQGR